MRCSDENEEFQAVRGPRRAWTLRRDARTIPNPRRRRSRSCRISCRDLGRAQCVEVSRHLTDELVRVQNGGSLPTTASASEMSPLRVFVDRQEEPPRGSHRFPHDSGGTSPMARRTPARIAGITAYRLVPTSAMGAPISRSSSRTLLDIMPLSEPSSMTAS